MFYDFCCAKTSIGSDSVLGKMIQTPRRNLNGESKRICCFRLHIQLPQLVVSNANKFSYSSWQVKNRMCKIFNVSPTAVMCNRKPQTLTTNHTRLNLLLRFLRGGWIIFAWPEHYLTYLTSGYISAGEHCTTFEFVGKWISRSPMNIPIGKGSLGWNIWRVLKELKIWKFWPSSHNRPFSHFIFHWALKPSFRH